MGLDMYFYKKSYVKNWEHTPDEQRHSITVRLNGKVRKDIKRERISSVVEEVAYWRKFNALHNWFIQNCADGVDDCREVYIETSQIEELLEVLKQVKASLDASPKKTVKVESSWANGQKTFADVEVFENTAVVEELFPTASGFFFGGTEYDNWYYQDIVETIKTFEDLLKENEKVPKGAYSADYYYRASW